MDIKELMCVSTCKNIFYSICIFGHKCTYSSLNYCIYVTQFKVKKVCMCEKRKHGRKSPSLYIIFYF